MHCDYILPRGSSNYNKSKLQYLAEIQRIIKSGGHLWFSWFRSPPNEVCSDARRTVFTEVDIINMIGGWLTLKFTTAGMNTDYHNQWVMLGQVQ